MRPVLSVWLLLLLLQTCLQANVSDEELEEAIRWAYNYDSRGELVFKKMIQQNPEHPLGYFLMASLKYWEVLRDPRRDDWAEEAEDVIEEAVDVANDFEDENEGNPEGVFYRGMVYSVKTMFNLARENVWSTFWNGRRSLSIMEDMLEMEPDRHDAKLIPGVANCYLDNAPGYLKPVAVLLGYSGEVKTGLQLLRECIQNGRLAPTEAAWYLGTVHLEITRDFKAAAEVFNQLVEDHPLNPLMRYRLVRAYELDGDYRNALQATQYPKQLESVVAHAHQLFWLRFREALMLHHLDRQEEALRAAQQLIDDLSQRANEDELLAMSLRLKARALLALERDDEALTTLQLITRSLDKQEYRAAQRMIEELPKP